MASKEQGAKAKADQSIDGRDASGLLPAEKAKSEAETRAMYFKMLGGIMGFYVPLIATGIYLAAWYLLPGQAALISAKLAFIREYGLGYVYAAWYAVFLARAYAGINANGARGPARVDRPDQHIYQIMATSGPLASAPYVMMANTGVAGRFNRAQRAASNMDEGLAVFLAGLLLQGAVFGPIAFALACLYLVGSYSFCNGYKEDGKNRLKGFMMTIFAVHVSGGLMLLVAFQTLIRPMLPL